MAAFTGLGGRLQTEWVAAFTGIRILQIIRKLDHVDERLIARVIDRPRLTATQLKEYVETFTQHPDALERDEGEHRPAPPGLLSRYGALTNNVGSLR